MTRTPYHRRPEAGAPLAGTAKVFPRTCHEKTSLKAGGAYGFGLDDVVVSVLVFISTLPSAGGALVMVFVVVSLVLSWLAGGFTMVVLLSVFLSAAGAAGATSVLCSHAPKSAALARMQINFFIVVDWFSRLGTKPESEQGEFPALRKLIFRKPSAFGRRA